MNKLAALNKCDAVRALRRIYNKPCVILIRFIASASIIYLLARAIL